MSGLLEQIVGEALERPAAERAAFLARACGADAALRREVESLLRAHEDAGTFMAHPTGPGADPGGDGADRSTTAAAAEPTGGSIGRYKLLERIGEGGFGTVYMAEQRQPVQRRVALKVIKPGMDSRQVIARFEAERQALAMMDHPNIARVLDAGATEAQSPFGPGRPYFVMELVRGLPITQFCDEHRLPLRERLALFIDACQAVQHAHQKGVIHRDLKPSNVLVSRYDERPVVKIIDFGIAKAVGGRLTDRTLFTELRQMIGTPAYMSPEQAGLSDLDVDTRSDIYSLGVLLYELLTGTTPFDATRLRSVGFDELRRIIREEEPPRPSTRLSALLTGGKGSGLKGPRGRGFEGPGEPGLDARPHGASSSTPGPLGPLAPWPLPLAVRQLRGELDWIAMKCLEKDRTRRYETANSLAADVRRHVAGEPVVAAPPSRFYRLSKMLRRHRWPVAVGGGFVALIAIGLGVSLTLWRGASAARDAESDQRARAEAINAFLKEMLTAADPAKAKGATLTVREALDKAAKGIDENPIVDQPLVEAEIRFTIGSTYLALSLFGQAAAQLRAADAIQTRELGDEHLDTLRTRSKLVETLCWDCKYADSITLAEATLAAQTRILGPDHPDTLQCMLNLGNVLALAQSDRFSEAESLLRSVVERRERLLGNDHIDTAAAMDQLGGAYTSNSYPEKAELLHREALRINTRALGEEDPSTLISMYALASSLINQRRPYEAEAMFRRVLELRTRLLGPDNINTIGARSMLGTALQGQYRYAEAESLYRECLADLLRTGPTHADVITEYRFLASCLGQQRKFAEAEALLREALVLARERFGPEAADTTIRTMSLLAWMLGQQRKDAEAEHVARQVIELQRRQRPRPVPAEFSDSMLTLIRVLKRRGTNEEALQVEQELIGFCLEAARAPGAGGQTLRIAARRLLFPEHARLRDLPQALELAREANQRTNYLNPNFLHLLAQAHQRGGDSAHAAQVWDQALALLTHDEARAAMFNQIADDLLFGTPESTREPAAALNYARRANEISARRNAEYLRTLARAYVQSGDAAAAAPVWEEVFSLAPNDAARAVALNDAASWFLNVTPASLRDPRVMLNLAVRAAHCPGASAQHLNFAAWQLLTINEEGLRDPCLALEFALKSNELGRYEDPRHLDTLALAYHRAGDTEKAIEIQKKALALLAVDAPDRAEYENRLREFRAASERAADARE